MVKDKYMAPLIVSPQWLNSNLNDPDLVVLDASPQDNKAGKKSAFNGLYIKHSRQFDLKLFSNSKSNLPSMLPSAGDFQDECRKLGINNSSKIIVYDNLGIYTSPRVWWMFRVMGHENISVLDGGLPSWVNHGFETVSSLDHIANTGNFIADYNPDLLAGIDQVIDNLNTKKAVLIDARSEGRFKGIIPEPREGLRSGHIPYSVNIPFEEVLERGCYKSPEDLKEIFSKIPEDKPLIFSCGSGITACIILLACEMVCKNNKAVFDGSWTQWALTGDLPVETSGK